MQTVDITRELRPGILLTALGYILLATSSAITEVIACAAQAASRSLCAAEPLLPTGAVRLSLHLTGTVLVLAGYGLMLIKLYNAVKATGSQAA